MLSDSQASRAEQISFRAQVAHLGPMTEYPIFHSGYPAAENLVVDTREVPILDARAMRSGARLATHGFELLRWPSRVQHFMDIPAIAERYVQEIAEIVKAVSGAREVLASPLALASRYSDRSGAVAGGERAARFCHNDYTPGSTLIHIVNEFPHVDRARLKGPYAAYNVWRCLTPPPQDMPLALCDPRSVAPSDVVAAEARYGAPPDYGVWGEVALLRFSPRHRWYSFPDMRPEEILIFCGYHSDPRFPSIVPHTAVEDPRCPPGTPARHNLDIRCYALFD